MSLPDVEATMDVLIVGAGSIGQKEIGELQHHPLIRLIGVVDTDTNRRTAVSGAVPTTYATLSEALTEMSPDLVRIATPPHTHSELALAALEAQSDVYLEKIMALNSTEAQKIVTTAETVGQSVYVRRNAIYTPVYQRAWNRLDRLGEIRHVHWIEPVGEYSEWSQHKQAWLRELPGGIISEHLPHALYTVRWYLGDEPSVVDVCYEGDELHVSLATDSKRARISYVSPADVPMLLDITGSKGTIRVDHSSMRIVEPRGFEAASNVERRTARANLHDLVGSVTNVARLTHHFLRRELNLYPDPFYSQSDNYRQFTDIANGGDTGGHFRIDGHEGVKNVELFETIWERATHQEKSASELVP